MNREELETLTRQAMDAVGSRRWGSAEIRARNSSTFDDEWADILDAAPFYRAQVVSVTTAADGTFPVSSLTTGTGDSLKRFYRIAGINDGNQSLREISYIDAPIAQFTNYIPQYPLVFYLLGQSYQVLPKAAHVLNVVVNYKPQALADLSADNIDFDFPAGAEHVLAYASAARLLNKGGAEAMAARELFAMAADERARMLNEIRRRTMNPTVLRAPDSAMDWAG